MKPSLSFGFSPIPNINQNYADFYDCTYVNNKFNCSDNKRLSWHLTNIHGGWRIGNISELNSSPSYQKYIFLKNYKDSKLAQVTKALSSSKTTSTKSTTTSTKSTSTTTSKSKYFCFC